MSEADIINKIKGGDIDALGDLFEIYKNFALKTVYLITGDIYASEDIVQEAFIKCYYNINDLKNIECFKSWFFKILTRMSWKYSNKSKKLVPKDSIYDEADIIADDNQEAKLIRDDEFKMLHEAISNLELKQKTTIILYYFNNLSIKEISKIMGCFEGTVKSRLHTARKNLEAKLETFEYDDLNSTRKGDMNENCKLI